MKKVILFCSISTMYLFLTQISYAQKGQNEFELSRVEGSLDATSSVNLNNVLKGDDAGIIAQIQTILTSHSLTPVKGSAANLTNISDGINSTITDITAYGAGPKGGSNAAVIIVYRDMSITNGAGATADIDFSSLKTLIYHKKRNQASINNYLLATKKIYFIFIDLDDAFYQNKAGVNNDKKLENTQIKIQYKTSFFKQSFQDAKTVWQGVMGGGEVPGAASMKFTLVEVDPNRVKEPCDIIASNKTIKEDLLTFPIHERNFASFQIGVENTNYALSNFSIANDSLSVKPDSTQKKNWKSSLYAVIELHIPRDIDNFQPLWKDIFSKGKKRNVGQYLYDGLISRIGIYGGVKVSKDPLSNLYAGFNFAITKELSANFGWTWSNQVIPQVTEIGNITSLDDALKYAKRKYSAGKFSWGLSFAPSAVIDMLGLKAKGK